MAGKRNQSPDPKGVGAMYARASETVGTHLAHWPPPRHERETQPIMTKHSPAETAHRARPRGWRLTRAAFSEFADEEE